MIRERLGLASEVGRLGYQDTRRLHHQQTHLAEVSAGVGLRVQGIGFRPDQEYLDPSPKTILEPQTLRFKVSGVGFRRTPNPGTLSIREA